MITGIHHVSMKCAKQQFEKVHQFYTEVLGLQVARQWDGGIMYDTGNGLIELFTNADDDLPKGVIRHFALASDDVDGITERLKSAGYEVFSGPKDIAIASNPPFPARIAFCHGPLGEEIELFQEK